MDALTNSELFSIQKSLNLPDIEGKIFTIETEQGAPVELMDVLMANQLIDQVKGDDARIDRFFRVVNYLLEHNKTGQEPLTVSPERYKTFSRYLKKKSPSKTTKQISLLPVKFSKPGKIGDFAWMIQQPKYQRSLFIFNDNQEQFEAYLRYRQLGISQLGACSQGGGNAIIRPYQCQDPPRAAGIPTGKDGMGYQVLRSFNSNAITYIDAALKNIHQLLATGNYDQVIYSADEDDYIGSGIFNIADEVKKYITEGLWEVVANFRK